MATSAKTSSADPLQLYLTDFPRFVSERIHALGWTNEEAARRAGISPSTLNQILYGKRTPRVTLALQLCVALGLSPLSWQEPSSADRWPVTARKVTPLQRERAKTIDSLASEIERLMKRAQLNQPALSKASGVHISTISRLLKRRAAPADRAIERLRNAMKGITNARVDERDR